jgi:hypothetical protein
MFTVKSKISIKIELWKMMKGVCFTFNAFGQWSEHDMSKINWRMKVGVEWRPSMANKANLTIYP